MAATEPIKSKKQLRGMAKHWLKKKNFRNYILVVLGAYMTLRVSDLLKIRWMDVYNSAKGVCFSHITITEQKTGKKKKITLNSHVKEALLMYLPHKRGEYIFVSNRKNGEAIGRTQAWRIIKEAANAVGLTGPVGCHSLRKTFGYFAWKSGVNPVLIMDLYNHSSYETTRRYLGIDQAERDEVYMSAKLL